MSDRTDPNSAGQLRAGRRKFFLQGMSVALNALSDLVQQVSPVPIPEALRKVLRPPGALAEQEFLKTCYRCGSCVDACPVHAIKPLQSADSEESGTPFIDPDLQACELCEDVACGKACPSGALARMGRQNVRMGVARCTTDKCLRTTGHDCRICLDRCPVPTAIRLGATSQMEILGRQCTGCGVCQQLCPARPKAIYVQPL